ALNVDDKDPETKEELYGSHDQKIMDAEIQAPESRVKTQNAETQTTEFEYLFKQMSSVTQCLFVCSSHLEKTTIIIDCFEIFIERPSNLLARVQTFSRVSLDS
ncbi:unnamed protein product, partial [Porites lobata]